MWQALEGSSFHETEAGSMSTLAELLVPIDGAEFLCLDALVRPKSLTNYKARGGATAG